MRIIYISLSGNTKNFVERLSDYVEMTKNIKVEAINVKELNHDIFQIDKPFVSFLPSYLEGGNGIHNGDREVLTTDLANFLAAYDNYKKCYGIIGSGNRNFNKQFCLTAYQYAERFQFPLIDVFELRGTQKDIERIAGVIIEKENEFCRELVKENVDHVK